MSPKPAHARCDVGLGVLLDDKPWLPGPQRYTAEGLSNWQDDVDGHAAPLPACLCCRRPPDGPSTSGHKQCVVIVSCRRWRCPVMASYTVLVVVFKVEVSVDRPENNSLCSLSVCFQGSLTRTRAIGHQASLHCDNYPWRHLPHSSEHDRSNSEQVLSSRQIATMMASTAGPSSPPSQGVEISLKGGIARA